MSLKKNAFWLSFTKVLNLCMSMLVTSILSRYRTLGEYGVYSQILLVVNLGTSLFMLGMPSSINYFLNNASDKLEQNKFLSHYFTIGTLLSAFLGLLLFSLLPFLARYFGNDLIYSYWFMLVLLPWVNIFSSTVDNIFIAYEKVSHLMVYRFVHAIALFVTALICVVINSTFINYMRAYIIVQVIFSIYVYVIAQRFSGRFTYKINFSLVKKIFVFSIPLGLSSVVSTLNIEVDKLMIGGIFDTETLAVYSNASKELPVNIISLSIASVLMPKIVRLLKDGNKHSAIDLWKNSIEISFVFLCFFCMLLFVFAPQVISILYSDKYLDGVTVFRVYMILLLQKVTYFGMFLNATNNTKYILKNSLIALILNVIFNLLLYRIFGIIGPALATLISVFVMSILHLRDTSKILSISIINMFPIKKLLYILCVNSVIGIVGMYLYNILNCYIDGYVSVCVVALLMLVIYLIIMKKHIVKFIKLKKHQ